MNDNGLPGAPRSASQFNQPALIKNFINLNLDGTLGRRFPEVEGDFLVIDAVDYPCRISFGDCDIEQSVPCCVGFEVHGNFSGITLWHDNLSGVAATALLRLAFSVGRGKTLIQNDAEVFNGLSLPSFLASATTTTTRRDVPIPYGARRLRFWFYNLWTFATTPFAGQFLIFPLVISGVNMNAPAVTRNGIAYANVQNNDFVGYISPQQVAAAQWAHALAGEVSMPLGAERMAFQITLSGAVTSNDGSQLVVTAR